MGVAETWRAICSRRTCRSERLLAVAATTALISLGAAACGSAVNLPIILTAADVYTATVNAGSAFVVSTVTFTTGNSKVGSRAVVSGPYAWESKEGRFTSVTTADGEPPVTTQQIIDGSNIFSETTVTGLSTGASAGLPGVNSWQESIWTGDPSTAFSGGIWGLLSAASGQMSPSSILALLSSDAESVTDVGTQTISGVLTTHYRERVDLPSLGVPESEIQQAARAVGSNWVEVDYWVDASRLLRQLTMDIKLNSVALAQPTTTSTSTDQNSFAISFTPPVTISLSLELSQYGVPVDATPPPASEVTSVQSCTANSQGFNCQ